MKNLSLLVLLSCFLRTEAQTVEPAQIRFNASDLTYTLPDCMSVGAYDNVFFHDPSKEDYKIYHKHSSLINKVPDQKNFLRYYKLACAAWQIGKLDEAEKMFRAIYASKEEFYHSIHFSTESGRYLSMICIERGRYQEALSYLRPLIILENENHSCFSNMNRYHGLTALSYMGLQQYDSVIQLFITDYEYPNPILINAIKSAFTKQEIIRYLDQVESSFQFRADTIENIAYDKQDENGMLLIDPAFFIQFSASFSLFGYIIDRSSFYDDERDLLKNFRITCFYKELYKYASDKD